jgi:hypothetical protein
MECDCEGFHKYRDIGRQLRPEEHRARHVDEEILREPSSQVRLIGDRAFETVNRGLSVSASARSPGDNALVACPAAYPAGFYRDTVSYRDGTTEIVDFNALT